MGFSRPEYWVAFPFSRGSSQPQGIFPTQGSNPGLPHCMQILYHLSYKGSPRILEWVAYPFSSGSSWPRNWIKVSCIAGRFFTSWATREAKLITWIYPNEKKVKVLVIQSFPTLGESVDCSSPGSMEFSRQEYWSGLPFPSPGNLPDPGIELGSPALQADSLLTEPPGKTC